MASPKKRRKANKAAKKGGSPSPGVYRHPDGDRRHRGGPSAKQAIRDKDMLRRSIGAVDLPEEKTDETDESQ